MTDTVTGHTAKSAAAVVPVNTLAAATSLDRLGLVVLFVLFGLLSLRFIAVPPE
ncbi:hypothetical protein [Streptomyces sp. NPDC054756]